MSVIVCLSSGEKCIKFPDQTPVADAVNEIRSRLTLKGGGIENCPKTKAASQFFRPTFCMLGPAIALKTVFLKVISLDFTFAFPVPNSVNFPRSI